MEEPRARLLSGDEHRCSGSANVLPLTTLIDLDT